MQQEVDDDVAARRRRALYRARHRGTREMDFLLGTYADARLAGMTADELALFEHLLTLPDPELMSGIIEGTGDFAGGIATLVRRIRDFHRDKS